jgi:hypothetical protein
MITSARHIYDNAPLGALVRFSDGTAEPPARHRLKRQAWQRNNRTGRLISRSPANAFSSASFTLHIGDFGSGGVTVVSFFEEVSVTSRLAFEEVETPPHGSHRIVAEEPNGSLRLLRIGPDRAAIEDDLVANPAFNGRCEPCHTPEQLVFTYETDPAHGWLIVSDADLARFAFTRADFSRCSYVSDERIALEEDCDMPKFLRRLDGLDVPYRLAEHAINVDAPVRRWAPNVMAPAP